MKQMWKTSLKTYLSRYCCKIWFICFFYRNVIYALSEGKKRHIPFRNSTLTRLLQECLGSSCQTSFIVCKLCLSCFLAPNDVVNHIQREIQSFFFRHIYIPIQNKLKSSKNSAIQKAAIQGFLFPVDKVARCKYYALHKIRTLNQSWNYNTNRNNM